MLFGRIAFGCNAIRLASAAIMGNTQTTGGWWGNLHCDYSRARGSFYSEEDN